MHAHARATVSNRLFSLTNTFFKCSVRVVKSIYHHCRAWRELIAGLFYVWVHIEASKDRGGGARAEQLTTAEARSAPREAQLRTSVSTPNTIILQTHNDSNGKVTVQLGTIISQSNAD